MNFLFNFLGLIFLGTMFFLVAYAWALWITKEERGHPPMYKLGLSIIVFGLIAIGLSGFEIVID